jgi:glutaredoxin
MTETQADLQPPNFGLNYGAIGNEVQIAPQTRSLASSLKIDTCATVKITLYKKAGCPWSAAIIGFLNELNIPYEIRNVTSNPSYAEELRVASGQCMSPSLIIDGTMLADASVEDVAKVLGKRGLII